MNIQTVQLYVNATILSLNLKPTPRCEGMSEVTVMRLPDTSGGVLNPQDAQVGQGVEEVLKIGNLEIVTLPAIDIPQSARHVDAAYFALCGNKDCARVRIDVLPSRTQTFCPRCGFPMILSGPIRYGNRNKFKNRRYRKSQSEPAIEVPDSMVVTLK